MSANNRVSNIVESQLPFFVRNDHPVFIAFLKGYFEYLEQAESTLNLGKAVERLKSLPDYMDIDRTHEELEEKFFDWFLESFPTDTVADRSLILKHVKDYYRARGTEKALKFFMQAVYGLSAEVYYPKLDILRASGGVWYIQKSLRISGITVDGVANTDLTGLQLFTSTRIRGDTSNASAIVESADRFYESGILIDELVISGIMDNFENSEVVWANVTIQGETVQVKANVLGGGISTATITTPGTGYSVGQTIPIEDSDGTGAVLKVSSVTSGNLSSVIALYGGAGFRVDDTTLISGGGGVDANVKVFSVDESGTYHPNTYNIYISSIAAEANTLLSNTYANLNNATANTIMANAFTAFEYANTGPILIMEVVDPGTDYTSSPTIDAIANNRVRALGILGRIDIEDGGTGYANGDIIEFQNVFGGYGVGANATVEVDGSGTIVGYEFTDGGLGGIPPGGIGYTQTALPVANVWTTTGTGASLNVTSILGDGESFSTNTGTIGAITGVNIQSPGSNYVSPVANLTQIGDGTAEVTLVTVPGVFTAKGRWLNDDSHLSSFSFLQDRDYYQRFSYVIRTKESLKNYRRLIDNELTPAGVGLFGDYMQTPTTSNSAQTSVVNTSHYIAITGQWTANFGNQILVQATSNHGLSNGDIVFVEFLDGDTANISNGSFTVTVTDSTNVVFTHSNTSPRRLIEENLLNLGPDGIIDTTDMSPSNASNTTLSDGSAGLYLNWSSANSTTFSYFKEDPSFEIGAEYVIEFKAEFANTVGQPEIGFSTSALYDLRWYGGAAGDVVTFDNVEETSTNNVYIFIGTMTAIAAGNINFGPLQYGGNYNRSNSGIKFSSPTLYKATYSGNARISIVS
jgi:hypothetical protein